MEKPSKNYVPTRDLAQTPDKYGKFINVDSDVVFAEENLDEIMKVAGWTLSEHPTILEFNSYLYWRNKIQNLVGTVSHIYDNGNLLAVHFYQTEELTAHPEFVEFNFKASPKHMGFLDQEQADQIIVAKASFQRTALSKTNPESLRRQEEYRKRKEKEAEEKKQEEEDRLAGPYPDISGLLKKVVRIDLGKEMEGKCCLVSSVDTVLGRVHLKYFDGRSSKTLQCRANGGDLEKITVIGDMIYAD
jgi:hypothetical protein